MNDSCHCIKYMESYNITDKQHFNVEVGWSGENFYDLLRLLSSVVIGVKS